MYVWLIMFSRLKCNIRKLHYVKHHMHTYTHTHTHTPYFQSEEVQVEDEGVLCYSQDGGNLWELGSQDLLVEHQEEGSHRKRS